MNPFRFARGMATAALRAGAEVFSHSPVRSIERAGSRWRVATERGCVDASRVVVCPNGYTTALLPALARAWCPFVAYGLALRPLPESLRARIIPSGAALSQLPTGFHPTLVDERGRIVTALIPSAWTPHRSDAPLREAVRWRGRVFPQTRGVMLELESYWTGAMAWSPDQLPRIFEVEPGLHALMCFSGEGNVLAPLLGRHLAQALARDALAEMALPVRAPTTLRFRGRYDFAIRVVGVPMLRLAERLGLF